MTNQFCHFLTNGYTLNVVDDQLATRPCCLYPKNISATDRVELALVDSWIPECKECRRVEQIGVKSMRQLSYERVQGNFAPGVCVSLEVNFDKKCNAACLSCAPKFSSTWERYNRKFNLAQQITQQDPAELLQELIDRVPLDQLQFLYIQGGEPFYSDTNLHLIEHLLKVHPDPRSIVLHYQTNGSILPSEQIIEYWQQFKSVVINYSIDDIGERFNYLRWPLDWLAVEQNIQTMLATTNVDIKINSTINPFNVLNYDGLESWIVNTIPKNRLLSYRAGASLNILDLRYTPKALREHVVAKYGAGHRVSLLFNNNELFDYRALLDYVEQHDANRRLDWRATFPESVPFFKS